MGVIKRYIHQTLEYSSPKISFDTDRFIILRNLSQANNTGLIGQISALFEYTQEIFTELVEEATETAKRIEDLGQRVNKLYETLPNVEEEAESKLQLTNLGTNYSNKVSEDACQFLPDYRDSSMTHQYEECMPPPNLSLLDPYAGESCLKKYTNPMFFLESWVAEQERMYQEAKKKRAARRKGRGRANTTTTTKIAVQNVQLRRNKYNAMGQEFSSPVAQRSNSSSKSLTPKPKSPKASAPPPAQEPVSTPAPPTTTEKIPSPRKPVQEVGPVASTEKSSKKTKKSKDSSKGDKKSSKGEKKSKKPRLKKDKKSKEKLPPPPSHAAPPPPDEAPPMGS